MLFIDCTAAALLRMQPARFAISLTMPGEFLSRVNSRPSPSMIGVRSEINESDCGVAG